MSANLAALLYLVAGVLFILSLRGLSSPSSARQGNLFGMVGMALAVFTTLGYSPPASFVGWLYVIGGVAIGGGFGLAATLGAGCLGRCVRFGCSSFGWAPRLFLYGGVCFEQGVGGFLQLQGSHFHGRLGYRHWIDS